MINHTPLCTLLFPAFAAMASGAPPSTQEDAAHTAPGRYASLLKALDSKDPSVRWRAIAELGETTEDPRTLERLVDLLVSSRPDLGDFDRLQVAKVLPLAGSAVVPAIVKGYIDHPGGLDPRFMDPRFRCVLFILGRMGSKADKAVPFLLEQLDRHRGEPTQQAAIQVVLANIGHQPAAIAETLLADIRNRDQRAEAAVRCMAPTWSRGWVKDDMVVELCRWMESEDCKLGDLRSYIAVVLTVQGERQSSAADPLRRLVDADPERAVTYEFALASVDRSERKSALTRALRQIGKERYARLIIGLGWLLPPDMMAETVTMLEDDDPQVVVGAISLVSAAGLSSKAGTPVLRLLLDSSDEDVREEAAKALATVGHPSQIPTLEAIAKNEKSEPVREGIEESLRILRLQEAP